MDILIIIIGVIIVLKVLGKVFTALDKAVEEYNAQLNREVEEGHEEICRELESLIEEIDEISADLKKDTEEPVE